MSNKLSGLFGGDDDEEEETKVDTKEIMKKHMQIAAEKARKEGLLFF